MRENSMNSSIEANIINHDTLAYGTGFITEMVLLIDGPKKAHKQIKKLVENGYPPEIMDEPFEAPADERERYHRALELVYAIGRAAGREMNEIDHEGNIEHLYRIFRKGLVSSGKKKVIGSALERVFFDCGLGAGQILFLVRKPDTEDIFDAIMCDARMVFKEGVAGWAA